MKKAAEGCNWLYTPPAKKDGTRPIRCGECNLFVSWRKIIKSQEYLKTPSRVVCHHCKTILN